MAGREDLAPRPPSVSKVSEFLFVQEHELDASGESEMPNIQTNVEEMMRAAHR